MNSYKLNYEKKMLLILIFKKEMGKAEIPNNFQYKSKTVHIYESDLFAYAKKQTFRYLFLLLFVVLGILCNTNKFEVYIWSV